jgi:hypothetical protein
MMSVIDQNRDEALDDILFNSETSHPQTSMPVPLGGFGPESST